MAGGGDRAEIGNEVILDRRRKQRRQEDDVRNALVDLGEGDVERFRDEDVFGNLTAECITEDPGLDGIGLNDEEPRHGGSETIMSRARLWRGLGGRLNPSVAAYSRRFCRRRTPARSSGRCSRL